MFKSPALDCASVDVVAGTVVLQFLIRVATLEVGMDGAFAIMIAAAPVT
jgi:hypothetical protein